MASPRTVLDIPTAFDHYKDDHSALMKTLFILRPFPGHADKISSEIERHRNNDTHRLDTTIVLFRVMAALGLKKPSEMTELETSLWNLAMLDLGRNEEDLIAKSSFLSSISEEAFSCLSSPAGRDCHEGFLPHLFGGNDLLFDPAYQRVFFDRGKTICTPFNLLSPRTKLPQERFDQIRHDPDEKSLYFINQPYLIKFKLLVDPDLIDFEFRDLVTLTLTGLQFNDNGPYETTFYYRLAAIIRTGDNLLEEVVRDRIRVYDQCGGEGAIYQGTSPEYRDKSSVKHPEHWSIVSPNESDRFFLLYVSLNDAAHEHIADSANPFDGIDLNASEFNIDPWHGIPLNMKYKLKNKISMDERVRARGFPDTHDLASKAVEQALKDIGYPKIAEFWVATYEGKQVALRHKETNPYYLNKIQKAMEIMAAKNQWDSYNNDGFWRGFESVLDCLPDEDFI